MFKATDYKRFLLGNLEKQLYPNEKDMLFFRLLDTHPDVENELKHIRREIREIDKECKI